MQKNIECDISITTFAVNIKIFPADTQPASWVESKTRILIIFRQYFQNFLHLITALLSCLKSLTYTNKIKKKTFSIIHTHRCMHAYYICICICIWW